MPLAIITITKNGLLLGNRLKAALPDAGLHLLNGHATFAPPGSIVHEGSVGELVQRLWPATDGFIFIMASGIVVRLIAPLLDRKDRDPAVVVVDDAGRFAISLLSGHLGGANELAGRCAEVLGACAVVTTATDVHGLPSFDLLAKDEGWRIDDLKRIKVLNSLLLTGENIAIFDPSGRVRRYCDGRGNLTFHDTLEPALESDAQGVLLVTNRLLDAAAEDPRVLILRPKNLVLGIGCNRGTGVEEIAAVVVRQLHKLGLSEAAIGRVATAEAKRDEPGLVLFARERGLPLSCFTSSELNRVVTPSAPSPHAEKAIGARGVAEPAALLAANGGELLLTKVKSGNVTLAVAEIDSTSALSARTLRSPAP